MRHLVGSECVLLGHLRLWTEELLERARIYDTGNGRLHEEDGAVHFLMAEGTKHVHFWTVTNMFQGDMWIFAAPVPAVVGVDLTTNMRPALITENYGVQKSLIVSIR
jgi:hypothetical protein